MQPNINGDGAYLSNEWWITHLEDVLNKKLLHSELLASGTDTSSKIIEVSVTSFRLRTDATRFFSGLAPESDNIRSVVKVIEQASGKVLSEFTVESKQSTNFPPREWFVDDHADVIVATLKGGKR